MSFKIDDNDVISIADNCASYLLVENTTAKVKEIKQNIPNSVNDAIEHWITQGVDCEILRTDGRGWIKGKAKIKLSIEFEPDEPPITQVRDEDRITIAQFRLESNS